MSEANSLQRFVGRAGALLLMALPCLATGLLSPVQEAYAQNVFPSRPMRMIVTSEAGSAPDLLARLIGQKLNEALGQPVVVENRAGAGGVIGYEIASRAQPDGHTIVMSTVAFVTTSTIYDKLPYDPVKSFAPIARVASSPYILVVSPKLPATSLKGLIELARTEKNKLNYGSPGNGTAQHLTTELLKMKTGVDMVHVPYKSGAGAVNAVLSGEAQLFFAGMPPALPHVKSGRLRALAVTTAKRFSAVPEVPSLAEAGLPGLEVDQWHAIIAPVGVPGPIVEKLNAQVVRTVASPEIKQALFASGAEANPSTSEELRQLLRSEVVKWNQAARAAGLQRQ
ncbi:MAG: tripartite tricarboxylate transporter substrate binding protein [Burkholderiales bacterium]